MDHSVEVRVGLNPGIVPEVREDVEAVGSDGKVARLQGRVIGGVESSGATDFDGPTAITIAQREGRGIVPPQRVCGAD